MWSFAAQHRSGRSLSPSSLAAPRTLAWRLGLAAAALLPGVACRDTVAPSAATPVAAADGRAVASTADAAPLATLRWNAVARSLVAKYKTDPAARTYANVSLAQYAAVVAARDERGLRTPAAQRAAAAAASAVVLAYFYPAEQGALAGMLRADLAAEPRGQATRVAGGEAIGRAVGALVIARAAADRVDAPFTGTIPTGPGYWVPKGAPATPTLGQAATYFLTSGSELRPAAPPTFGSPAFVAALAEVRALSDGRTAAQDALAKRWSYSSGSVRMPGYWNEVAAALIARDELPEWKAAHVMALVNMAMMDATIVCFDAKYTYWLIRPSQADPKITLATSLSNHPSYPSSHSCTSGAGATALAHFFPGDASGLLGTVAEIGFSRIVGGLHYRFDVVAGDALGAAAAGVAVRRDEAEGLLTVVGLAPAAVATR